MVQSRPRYMVGWMPRVNGNNPGSSSIDSKVLDSLQCSRFPALQTLHMINFGARSLPPSPGGVCRDMPPAIPAPAAVVRRSRMDDVVNRMAKELSDAIAAAVGEDARVEACREKARAAGFELRVSLEAVIGFVSRTQQP